MLVARVLVGGALAAGGVASLLAPVEDLVATIHAYAVLPAWAAPYLAQGLPWVEAVIGLAVLVGLSQPFSLRAAAGLITLFWMVISQALVRRLSIAECGCFGQLWSFTPQQMWQVDAVLFVLAWWLVRRHTTTLSLDRRLS